MSGGFARKAACAAVLSLLAFGARAGEYSVSTDAESTRGDYGTGEDATVWTLSLGLRYSGERFNWSLVIPWLGVTAPPDVVVSDGMVQGGGGRGAGNGGGGGSGARTESGLGDVGASAGVMVLEENAGRPFVGLSAKVKFATADEARNLGTGANDYVIQIESAKAWLNGRAGYRWIGDTDDTDFRNVAYAAVGVGHQFAGGSDVGIEYFGEEAAVEDGAPRREISLYAARPVGERVLWRGYLLKGLSDASPDVGFGLGMVWAL